MSQGMMSPKIKTQSAMLAETKQKLTAGREAMRSRDERRENWAHVTRADVIYTNTAY